MRRLILSLLLLAAPAAAQDRSVPYWASIAAGQAAMRAGPDRSYPTTWVYQRRDLPLRVVQVLGPWRRVQEQDGTTGWMLSMLLADRRTGVVRGGLQPIRDAASSDGRVLWQAEEGVVGRLSHCDGQWCRIQVGARIGYMSEDALWGVAPGEVFR
jgi:SH3-like domain-containing protein